MRSTSPGPRPAPATARFSLEGLARPFAIFVERFYPDPFVFVVVLTAVTAGLALGLTDSGPRDALAAWGEGLSGLMAFIAQMALMVVLAHALAHTGPVAAALKALARLPDRPWRAYALVAFVSCLLSLGSWALGLVGGAVIARRVAIETARRGVAVHYPLLVATAYAGMTPWHMGYSGSAPLFVATPGHAMEAAIGVLPITETVLARWNLMAIAAVVATICVVCPLMHPARRGAEPIDLEAIERADRAAEASDAALAGEEGEGLTLGERLDRARALPLALGAALLAFLAHWFASEGLNVTLNIVVWTILALLLLFVRSTQHLVGLIRGGAQAVGPVLLQYPFYAGIMGLMTGTGLADVIAGAFAAIATPATLSFWAFLSGGLVNMFVPSGGGQWVVQGPIFLTAAEQLGVAPSRIVMGVAYGDQWTNLIQPFWTLPLLSIAGLSVRHILGYCFIVLFALLVVLAGALFLAGPGTP